ncbi:MAG: NrfD/PsrC family molybdoenzyme membrane anchor subunit [Anaerolineae bacterium]
MTAQTEKLPYGVGHISRSWIRLVVALLVLAGLGIYGYSQQLIHGEVVTGLRDIGTMGGAPWGLYIAFVVYFVGVSFAGITVAALIRLFNLDHLRPVARMAEVLTVISLILGAFCIIADVGQPGRALINLFRYARPGSPFFGTFTLVVSGYLFGSVVYLYLDGRRDAATLAKQPGRLQGFYRVWAAGYKGTPAERERHDRASFWLAIAILPLLVAAHSTLGFVFGLQVGRPGWFGTLQAPGFVALAGVSGLGHLIVLAAIVRKALKSEDKITMDIFKWLGNFLMGLTAVYLYFMVVEWLTSVYSAHEAEAALSQALLTGPYAPVFWVSVACLIIPFVLLAYQFVTKNYRLSWLVLSGLLVNVAAIGKRYLVVVPSQTHGTMMPYSTGYYSPTWVEYSVIVGLLALGALLFVLFIKVFPIMKLPEEG